MQVYATEFPLCSSGSPLLPTAWMFQVCGLQYNFAQVHILIQYLHLYNIVNPLQWSQEDVNDTNSEWHERYFYIIAYKLMSSLQTNHHQNEP